MFIRIIAVILGRRNDEMMDELLFQKLEFLQISTLRLTDILKS